ncbi:MAG: hypothetical protein KJ709_01135 [Nanoarchaeota archaeon]|nr:hypothetical protein [Nanoarchaeota archaeon]
MTKPIEDDLNERIRGMMKEDKAAGRTRKAPPDIDIPEELPQLNVSRRQKRKKPELAFEVRSVLPSDSSYRFKGRILIKTDVYKADSNPWVKEVSTYSPSLYPDMEQLMEHLEKIKAEGIDFSRLSSMDRFSRQVDRPIVRESRDEVNDYWKGRVVTDLYELIKKQGKELGGNSAVVMFTDIYPYEFSIKRVDSRGYSFQGQVNYFLYKRK